MTIPISIGTTTIRETGSPCVVSGTQCLPASKAGRTLFSGDSSPAPPPIPPTQDSKTATFSREDLLVELFEAYFECRRNKRNTINALRFETRFEEHLFALADELLSGTYRPGRLLAFIVKNPVTRDIFASDFRDRVVHHFFIRQLNPYFESLFINDSYVCRKGNGTLFGIRRVESHMKNITDDYSTGAYVLKLDIRGFFMNIDRGLLFDRLLAFTSEVAPFAYFPIVTRFIRVVLANDPTGNCQIRGDRRE